MSKFHFRQTWALLLAGALYLTACGGAAADGHDAHHDEAAAGESTEAAAAEMGPEYTSDYVCPMHCKGSGSDEPGKCPVCGMDYVARSDHEANGHSH